LIGYHQPPSIVCDFDLCDGVIGCQRGGMIARPATVAPVNACHAIARFADKCWGPIHQQDDAGRSLCI
jgi:hypothetical protein